MSFWNAGSVASIGYCCVYGLPSMAACMKSSIQFYRDVGSGHFAFGHLGIDEGFRVGVFDGYTEHQCAAASILSYLSRC